MSQFLKPMTIEEAVRMKSEYPGSLYMGGGTEINNPASRSHGEIYISLEGLNLQACVRGSHNTILGASATFQELIDWDECPPALREAASFLSSRNVRNMATVGGNIAAHLEDAYLVPALMALDAELELGSGEILPLTRYMEEERPNLILNVRFPHSSGQTAVKNVLRSAGGLSVLSVAVNIESDGDTITKAAVALSGQDGPVARLSGVEKALAAGTLRPGEELEKAVSEEVKMKSDLKGSAEYKKYLCGVTVSDCVARALEASK
jgi:putative selenate reductase FAD-binding subunit